MRDHREEQTQVLQAIFVVLIFQTIIEAMIILILASRLQ